MEVEPADGWAETGTVEQEGGVATTGADKTRTDIREQDRGRKDRTGRLMWNADTEHAIRTVIASRMVTEPTVDVGQRLDDSSLMSRRFRGSDGDR